MSRARKMGVLVPLPYFVEMEANSIYMEKVEGHSVKHLLTSGSLTPAGLMSSHTTPKYRK